MSTRARALRERAREDAEPGAHLDHRIARRDPGALHEVGGDALVDEEVLAALAARREPVAREELADLRAALTPPRAARRASGTREKAFSAVP